MMPSEQLQQSYKYFLHFIGRGLYSKGDFVVECERHGANRAFPSFILKRMKFGDKILLAQYTADRDKETNLALKQGKAEVFGYYTIHGLNLDAWQNEEFRNRLVSQLHVVATNTGGGTIHRKCGSYTIGVSYTITDELKDVIEKIEQLEKEMGIKVKIFVAGSFRHFPLKEICPVKFSRTGFYIELDKKLEGEIKDKFVGFIGDYEQRKYFLKSERESHRNLYPSYPHNPSARDRNVGEASGQTRDSPKGTLSQPYPKADPTRDYRADGFVFGNDRERARPPTQSAGLVLEGASSRVRFTTNQTDGRRGWGDFKSSRPINGGSVSNFQARVRGAVPGRHFLEGASAISSVFVPLRPGPQQSPEKRSGGSGSCAVGLTDGLPLLNPEVPPDPRQV